VAGFVPIGCLCLALFGLLPLVLSARLVVLPLSGLAVLARARHRSLGRSALLGLAVGIVATGVYDLFRLALVLVGARPSGRPSVASALGRSRGGGQRRPSIGRQSGGQDQLHARSSA
jgi:hypothetical protein